MGECQNCAALRAEVEALRAEVRELRLWQRRAQRSLENSSREIAKEARRAEALRARAAALVRERERLLGARARPDPACVESGERIDEMHRAGESWRTIATREAASVVVCRARMYRWRSRQKKGRGV